MTIGLITKIKTEFATLEMCYWFHDVELGNSSSHTIFK